jgi:outer membrane lipoprotein-sorting protein
MKTIVLTLALLISGINLAQDAKAQGILDKLSSKIKSYNSFYLEFTATVSNSESGINDKSNGKGWVQGNKYNTVYGTNTVISNGIKVWVVSADDKSVYTSSVTDDNQSFNPKKLMQIWETGFRNQYVKLEGTSHVINLYPKNPKTSQYHTVQIKINSSTNMLESVSIKMKDGTNMLYHLTKFTGNVEVSPSKFVFDKREYPGYQEVEG